MECMLSYICCCELYTDPLTHSLLQFVCYDHISQSRSGRSLGCGVVEFNSPQGALDAISSLNGEDLNGREMLVREYYQ